MQIQRIAGVIEYICPKCESSDFSEMSFGFVRMEKCYSCGYEVDTAKLLVEQGYGSVQPFKELEL